MISLTLEKKHVKDVANLQQRCFPDGWNEQMLLSGIDVGNLKGEVVYVNGELVGFLTYSVIDDFAELNDILVAPERRGEKIASFLMERFIKSVQVVVSKIFLEVRESNEVAISLYKKYGFSKISVRKKYYSDGENAIVMQKVLL